MSFWTDIGTQAGPVILGVAGIAGTYFGSRSAARESRHHARLETAYAEMVEMLGDLAGRLRAISRGAKIPPASSRLEATEQLVSTTTRIQLYASSKVMEQIAEILKLQQDITSALVLAREHREDAEWLHDTVQPLITTLDGLINVLVELMRDDLALKRRAGPRRGRVVVALPSGEARLSDVIAQIRAQHAAEQQGASNDSEAPPPPPARGDGD